MLRIIQSKSAEGAKSYYSRADYLSDGQELTGVWRGKGAAMLGLSGLVEKQAFERLCRNEHPETGQQLTLRHREGRTVGYDFNFHLPKGVSIAYALLEDDRILTAFQLAVDETMVEIERDAATRVRKHYGNTDRVVGNLMWATFIHKTARPVDGVPDPHLHAHCFVFNVVRDEKEEAWKAGQFREIKQDARYFEAAFHARLAGKVKSLGYDIVRRGKNWDIAQVPQDVADKFSRRTSLIEELARSKNIHDDERKASLGASSREAKGTELSMAELRQIWRGRLSDDEYALLTKGAGALHTIAVDRAAESMRHAAEHCFERTAVIPKRQLLAEALRYGVGDVSVEGVTKELDKQQIIVRELGHRPMATTKEVLAEERAIVAFVKGQQNSVGPLVNRYEPKRHWLNRDQQQAVRALLASKDRVQILRGSAGTGKTTLMSEAIEAIEEQGTPVRTFAPSAAASRGVLTSEGFKSTTVAELLVSEKLQKDVRGSVLWIDEAGLLSSRQLARVLDIAQQQDCRVVLSGDPRQHKSVERGDVLQMLEDERAVTPIRVQQIERQQGNYKRAVEFLATGNTVAGLEELQRLGWIQAIADEDERLRIVASTYAKAVARGKSILVVAPTHFEADQAMNAIRQELKQQQQIGERDRSFRQLKPAHLTTAEKADAAQLQAGDVLVFHQNLPGITRGTTLTATPELVAMATQYPERYSVYRESTLQLAKRDRIRITHTGATMDGEHRIYNGNLFTIEGFDKTGNIVLQNGWKIAKDFGHLAWGYTSTSHASQGKTVDEVILLESSSSFAAAGQEQLYVSLSRGRHKAMVFTDDFDEFSDAVTRRDERITATRLLNRNSALRTRRETMLRGLREAVAPSTRRKEAEYARG